MNCRDGHHLPKSGRIPEDPPDDIYAISRNRIGSQTHGGSPEKDREDLPRSPERDVSNLQLGRRGFPIVVDSRNREVEFFSPRADRSRERKRRVDFVGRLRLSKFCFQLNSTHGDTNSLRRRRHAIDGPPVFAAFFVMLRTVACLLHEIKATIAGMLPSSFIFLPGIEPATERCNEVMRFRFGPSSSSTTLHQAYSQ